MGTDSPRATSSRSKAWIQKYLADAIMLAILLALIVWAVGILQSDSKDKPQWLMVPLTAIYAILTLYMAAASFQTVKASQRSAAAMEESVREQQRGRWAAYAATPSFPAGYEYLNTGDGGALIVIGNAFRQPMLGMELALWKMESDGSGEPNLRYSSMLESVPIDIAPDDAKVNIQLLPSKRVEAQRVKLGEAALERFKLVFKGRLPQSSLLLVSFAHRADFEQQFYVYDISPHVIKRSNSSTEAR